MVPKLIGSKVVSATTIHRTNSTLICASWYEIEFHAHLSHLGFDGVYPIYWINESTHAIRYTYNKNACTWLSRTKWDTIWTKHQLNQESTHKCDKKTNCPNYIKYPNQHMIEETTLKRYQIKARNQFKKIPSNNKPNPLHFSWWHKVPRRKMFVFQGDMSLGFKTNWRQLMFKSI